MDTNQTSKFMDLYIMLDYDLVKKFLFVKPLNEKHVNGVYKKICGDICLQVVIRYTSNKPRCNMVKFVDEDCLKMWTKSFDEVFDDAMNNSTLDMEPGLINLENLIAYKEPFIPLFQTHEIDKDFITLVLTDIDFFDGALTIFMQGVAKKLYELVGEEYYVCFASVHEAIIHRKKLLSVDELKEILHESIVKTFGLDSVENLSEYVYIYDSKEDCLKVSQ